MLRIVKWDIYSHPLPANCLLVRGQPCTGWAMLPNRGRACPSVSLLQHKGVCKEVCKYLFVVASSQDGHAKACQFWLLLYLVKPGQGSLGKWLEIGISRLRRNRIYIRELKYSLKCPLFDIIQSQKMDT